MISASGQKRIILPNIDQEYRTGPKRGYRAIKKATRSPISASERPNGNRSCSSWCPSGLAPSRVE